MPVNYHHPTYDKAAAQWLVVRDCIAGVEAIRAGKERYLPKLYKQDETDYRAYQTRAVFYNATNRTSEALVGFLFRKPPAMEGEESDLSGDVDMQGHDLENYARTLAADIVSIGRGGSLVDYSDSEARPYLATYSAENIINWRVSRVSGKNVLSLLVLQEFAEEAGPDEFTPTPVVRFRVYDLQDGLCRVRTFKALSTAHDVAQVIHQTPESETFPSRRGLGLPFIPFIFHNATTNDDSIGLVPLHDIAHLNVAHYRNSADKENGLHVCGTPTPIVTGWDSENKELYLGSSHAWVTDSADAKAEFLEFTGAGLEAIAKAMQEKVDQMASLGARMIETRQRDAEAFETVQLRGSAETSALSKISINLSDSVTRAWRLVLWWAGTAETPDDIEFFFDLNRDFGTSEIPTDKLNAIVAAWQQGAISRETLFWNMQKGELIKPGKTLEEEMKEIEDEPPPMPEPEPKPKPEPEE